jgi:hypothetical protein
MVLFFSFHFHLFLTLCFSLSLSLSFSSQKNEARVYKLKGESAEEAKVWQERLTHVVDAQKKGTSAALSGAAPLLDKARALLGSDDTQYRGKDAFLNLKETLESAFDKEMFRSYRHGVAELCTRRGVAVPYEVLEDLPITPAWFVKKAERSGQDKKRFFVLQGKEVRYYESEQNGHPVSLKGSFTINASATVALDGPTVTVNTSDRKWVLTADSPSVAATWSEAIYVIIRQFDNDDEEDEDDVWDADDEELDIILPGQGVWLSKSAEKLGRKQRRYFVLLYGSRSRKLKFNYFKGIVDGKPSHRAGTIALSPATEVRCESNQLVIVSTVYCETILNVKQILAKYGQCFTSYLFSFSVFILLCCVAVLTHISM